MGLYFVSHIISMFIDRQIGLESENNSILHVRYSLQSTSFQNSFDFVSNGRKSILSMIRRPIVYHQNQVKGTTRSVLVLDRGDLFFSYKIVT